MQLLFDKIPNPNNNPIETALLFRASEHNYECKDFLKHCAGKGPTITIIHNEYNHVFGGYVTESWCEASMKLIQDPTAFLFGIRPKVTYIPFKKGTENGTALRIVEDMGPMFGDGADMGIEDDCNTTQENWACSYTFEFDTEAITQVITAVIGIGPI